MVNRKELNPDSSPQAAFGARLRRLREERGWRQDELGTLMGYSATHVSGVETGYKLPTSRFARSADQALRLQGSELSFERELREMRQGPLLEGFPEYVRYEGRAAEIRLFEIGVIPGPLQTPEYAQVLAESAVARGHLTPDQAEERVTLLRERQDALTRRVPPVVIVVMDESCVRRSVGGGTVMRGQMKHLLEVADLPNTVLQIAPFDLGEGRAFDRPVNILTMSDRSVRAYVEAQTHGQVDHELASVVPLMRDYHHLQAVSLSQAASVTLINHLRKGAK